MVPTYWTYYSSIEQDLVAASRYVEFVVQNRDTYSIEFARILLAAASEVDVVAKDLCLKIEQSSKPRSIEGYRSIIKGRFSRFPFTHINLPRYDIRLTPWWTWSVQRSPTWWMGYNAVKHRRNTAFHDATLRNALNATAGLLVLLLHLYELEYGAGVLLEPIPQLILPPRFQQDLTMIERKCYWTLPNDIDDGWWKGEFELDDDRNWSCESY